MSIQLLMFINMSIAYNDGIERVIWWSYGIEILLLSLMFIIAPISLYIFSTISVFHKNLVLITGKALPHFYIYAISRLTMIFYETGFIGVLVERSMATVYFATYEFNHRRSVLLWFIFIGIPLSFILNSCYFFAISFFTQDFMGWLEMSVSFSCGVGTYFLSNANANRIKELHLNGYTLNKRYQLTVNVKAIKVIILYILHTAFNNILFSILHLLHTSTSSSFIRNILGIVINVQLAFQLFIFSFIGLVWNRQIFELSKKKFLEKFYGMIIFRRDAHQNASTSRYASERVVDCNGKEMYTGASQNDYFNQLNSQWGP
ncbi:unnamed protein product, partial [Mesorhabditis belari]|uniref:Gustatory receptor n=1 Tax=Mesorhabditis belari TaxID=2138241 RepID=A0AAF3J330_9BILA